MEEIKNFDQWLRDFVIPKNEYYAIYNPETYVVTGVYPGHSAASKENKVLIDEDFAQAIFDGRISLSSCFVDISDGSVEVVQTQTIVKIDDILHRIPNKEFSDITESDLSINFNSSKKLLTFFLNEKIKNKKIQWAGNTELRFFITEYNDPHKTLQVIKFKLEDLYKDDLLIDYLGSDLDFSIFTSRIFKKYIFEKQ
jgi:hypothetical protein